MKVNIQSIHFDADKKLLEYIDKKANKLLHFYDKIIDIEVYLKIENSSDNKNKFVEIKVNVPHDTLIAKETSESFEKSTDIVKETLKRQIKKYKEKSRVH